MNSSNSAELLQTQRKSHSTLSLVQIKDEKSPASVSSLIARGAFGQVDIALLLHKQHLPSKSSLKIRSVSLAAIKTIPNATNILGSSSQQRHGARLTREAFAELNSLRLLNGHENVTPLLGYYGASDASSGDGFGGWDWADGAQDNPSPTSLCLVFPYHPIDLHEALIYRRFNASSKFRSSYFLPKQVVTSIMHDLLSALQHLHTHSILHRDIKPSNLYITREGQIQLGDFGLAKIVPLSRAAKSQYSKRNDLQTHGNGVTLTNGLCTLQYRPPEVLLGGTGIIHRSKSEERNINGAFDMFSAGCVIAELLTLSGPIFPGQSVLDQLGRVFQTLGNPTEDDWPGVKLLPDWNKVTFDATNGTGLHDRINRPDTIDELNILSNMLVLNPLRRYSARECLEHRLFQNIRGNNYHSYVCESLLPVDMQVMNPIFSSPDDISESSNEVRNSLTFAKHYAAKKASSRRNFTTGLIESGKNKERWVLEDCR